MKAVITYSSAVAALVMLMVLLPMAQSTLQKCPSVCTHHKHCPQRFNPKNPHCGPVCVQRRCFAFQALNDTGVKETCKCSRDADCGVSGCGDYCFAFFCFSKKELDTLPIEHRIFLEKNSTSSVSKKKKEQFLHRGDEKEITEGSHPMPHQQQLRCQIAADCVTPGERQGRGGRPYDWGHLCVHGVCTRYNWEDVLRHQFATD